MAEPFAHPLPADAPAAPRTIVLVGMMGAGKSSVGRRLATRLGLPFFDADLEIEAAAGCTVPEFFARHGEPAFRDGERRVIARLLEGPPHVLATGGGAFVDPLTRERITAHGAVSVWLRADLDTLVRRCAKRTHRPLLNAGDQREVIARLLRERTPAYAQADIVVDSGDGPQDLVVQQIVDAVRARTPLPA